MSNTELFVLNFSFINPAQIYFNWYLSIYSPTDTIETDTFYLSYTNVYTSETNVINTGNVMNCVLDLSPETDYYVFVYSINQYLQQSANSNTVLFHTGNLYANPIDANSVIRPFETTELTEITIENLQDVVTVSKMTKGIHSIEPTFVNVVTASSTKPFYQLYKIDPKGQLFGNTFCDESAYKKRVLTI
jgi:hypothetical protein